jgi:hypothetical protein
VDYSLWQFSSEGSPPPPPLPPIIPSLNPSSGACISVTVTYVVPASVFPIHNRPLLLRQLHMRILHWASDVFNHPLQVAAPAAHLHLLALVSCGASSIVDSASPFLQPPSHPPPPPLPPLQLLAPLLTQCSAASRDPPPGDSSALVQGSHIFYCGILPQRPLLAHSTAQAICLKVLRLACTPCSSPLLHTNHAPAPSSPSSTPTSASAVACLLQSLLQ